MTELDHRFQRLTTGTCREHLGRASIGRVGWSNDRGPQILPVTYLLHDNNIVFRTDPHGPLASLQGGEPIVFEVDDFDATTRCGWSVVVRGRAYSTQRSPRATQLWGESDPVPWAGGQRPLFISITLEELSGRSIERQREDADDDDPGPRVSEAPAHARRRSPTG
jgi:nitroimidazol reductase NimA-like FMN-containing flavoprotein (pyridoxamine 5'-phosphate oxidase superfamily)